MIVTLTHGMECRQWDPNGAEGGHAQKGFTSFAFEPSAHQSMRNDPMQLHPQFRFLSFFPSLHKYMGTSRLVYFFLPLQQLYIVSHLQCSPVLQGLDDRHPYVRRTAVMGVLKIYHIDKAMVENTGWGWGRGGGKGGMLLYDSWLQAYL